VRTALGTPTAPPNFLDRIAGGVSDRIQDGALQRAYDTGIRPLSANEITAEQEFERGSQPLRAFTQRNVRETCCGLGAHVDRHDDAATRVVSLPFKLISCWVDAGAFLRAG
jgi:flagellar biosynthesis protein FliP